MSNYQLLTSSGIVGAISLEHIYGRPIMEEEVEVQWTKYVTENNLGGTIDRFVTQMNKECEGTKFRRLYTFKTK